MATFVSVLLATPASKAQLPVRALGTMRQCGLGRVGAHPYFYGPGLNRRARNVARGFAVLPGGCIGLSSAYSRSKRSAARGKSSKGSSDRPAISVMSLRRIFGVQKLFIWLEMPTIAASRSELAPKK